MEEQLKECTCRGGNPNCVFCGGLGSVKRGLGSVRPVSNFRYPASVKKKSFAIETKCPYCETRTKNLAQHISTDHPTKWDDFVSSVKGKKPLRCNKCGAVFTSGRQSKLDKHSARCKLAEPILEEQEISIHEENGVMSFFQFFVNLRSEILSIIGGVENSSRGLLWDNTTPNYAIKNQLEDLYKTSVEHSPEYGVYIVNRHLDCGNPDHYANDEHGYVMEQVNGEYIGYRDDRYVWGDIAEARDVNCKCPCSETNKPTKHHVIKDVLYNSKSNQDVCATISSVLDDLLLAMRKSGDNRPRSAIREYLLRAIIKINDALLPKSMDKYIEETLLKETHTQA